MALADKIIQVEGVAGTIASIINRGGSSKLVNQKILDGVELEEKELKEIPLDVVISYDVTLSNQKTSNPVQIGVNVNDHIFKDPNSIVINFGVTDFGGTLARLRGLYDLATSGWNNYKAGDSISSAMLDTLITASYNKMLFSINDGLYTHKNLVIDSINYVRDKRSHRALIATITMSELIFVEAGNVNIASNSVPTPYDKTEFAEALDSLTNLELS